MPGADGGHDGVGVVLVRAFGRAVLVLGGRLVVVVGRDDRVLRHHLDGLDGHGVHGLLQDVLHLLRVLLVVHLRTYVVDLQVMRVLDEGVVVAEGGLALLEVLLPELRMLDLFFFDGVADSGVVDGGLNGIDFAIGCGRICIVVFLVVVGRVVLLLFLWRIFHLLT